VTQVVEHLPSKCEVLSSNSSTEKKKVKPKNSDTKEHILYSFSFIWSFRKGKTNLHFKKLGQLCLQDKIKGLCCTQRGCGTKKLSGEFSYFLTGIGYISVHVC
jgi:hypothetical protein